jgi:hypothetical protein
MRGSGKLRAQSNGGSNRSLRSDPGRFVSYEFPSVRLFSVDVEVSRVEISFVASGKNVNIPMTRHDCGVAIDRDLDLVALHRLVLGRTGLYGGEVAFPGVDLAVGMRVNEALVVKILKHGNIGISQGVFPLLLQSEHGVMYKWRGFILLGKRDRDE